MLKKMRIKYVSVFSKNVKEEIDFLTNKLGFMVKKTLHLQEGLEACVLESKTFGDDGTKLLVINAPILNYNKTVVILNTLDCIRSYHELKSSGIFFAKGPYYTQTGMSVEFEDPSGNNYILLEERDYEDKFAV